jgi:hypothetical protein
VDSDVSSPSFNDRLFVRNMAFREIRLRMGFSVGVVIAVRLCSRKRRLNRGVEVEMGSNKGM